MKAFIAEIVFLYLINTQEVERKEGFEELYGRRNGQHSQPNIFKYL